MFVVVSALAPGTVGALGAPPIPRAGRLTWSSFLPCQALPSGGLCAGGSRCACARANPGTLTSLQTHARSFIRKGHVQIGVAIHTPTRVEFPHAFLFFFFCSSPKWNSLQDIRVFVYTHPDTDICMHAPIHKIKHLQMHPFNAHTVSPEYFYSRFLQMDLLVSQG